MSNYQCSVRLSQKVAGFFAAATRTHHAPLTGRLLRRRAHREWAHQITTSAGIVALEILENGLPPRFQLWSDPSRSIEAYAIKIETVRACGVWQRFTMTDREGYLESIEGVPEPHAFTAYLLMGGETCAVEFPKPK